MIVSSGRIAISLILSLVFTVLHVHWIVQFALRWQAADPFILARSPALSVAMCSMLIFAGANLMFDVGFWPNYPIALYIFHVPILLAWVGGSQFVRMLILYARFEITGYVVQLKFDPSHLTGSTKYFLLLKLISSNGFVVVFLMFWGLLCFAAPIAYVSGTIPLPILDAANFFFLILLSFLFGLVGFKVKGKYDFWGVKKEFVRLAIISGLAALLFIIFFGVPLIAKFLAENPPYLSAITFNLAFCTVTYVSMGIPSQLSATKRIVINKASEQEVAETNLITSPTVKGRVAFEEMLQDEEFFQLFQNHLMLELSVENLYFWKALMNFEAETMKITASDSLSLEIKKEVFTKAKNISKTFIASESEFEINISTPIRRACLDKIDALGTKLESLSAMDIAQQLENIFEEPKNAVLLLLQQDSLTRFVSTPDYKSFCKSRLVENLVLVKSSAELDAKGTLVLKKRRNSRKSGQFASNDDDISSRRTDDSLRGSRRTKSSHMTDDDLRPLKRKSFFEVRSSEGKPDSKPLPTP